ncbi:MAG: IPT/TIG domain-containing protein [Chloroflexi bacterium]|nr:IPT/TIG domain-containing protein [Chloroflexota bacterium]
MKTQIKILVTAVLAVVLVMSHISTAFAATVISVSPSTISNRTANIITVTGTGFDSSARIVSGSIVLPTAFNDESTLTATVPAGVAPGSYELKVKMDSGMAAGSATLVVYSTEVPTSPVATPTLPDFVRPQLVITSYKANVSLVQSGKEFKLYLGIGNPGTAPAFNVQAAFSSQDLIPTRTGGVAYVGAIPMGGTVEASQTFLAADSLSGKTVVVVDVTLSYYDDKGTAYSDKFTLSVPAAGGSSGVYATATPTGVKTAQLVITSYVASVDPLEPGETFKLTMTVENMGNSAAKSVTMIVGGGSSGDSGGTPQPGGVSGGSGEFTNFAPVGTSNVQSLGNLSQGGKLQVSQNLIVNVSTAPGAYPMKITFSYVNDKGEVVNDDQVITLLVYSLPKVDIGFYRDPGALFAGQSNVLPIQVVNLGKRTAVLGNMTLATDNGTMEMETTLVGSLDAGGYFTFDGSVIPDTAGPLKLTLTIEYTDDFNQPRSITKTLDLTVEEGSAGPTLEPGMEGSGGGGGGGEMVIPPSEETFLQKVWRFILGLFGLDSSAPSTSPSIEGGPTEMPVPMPGGGGGGGKG